MMRTMSPKEKRTLRLGSLFIGIYLVVFFGYSGWGWLAKKRADYEKLVAQAASLQAEIRPYEDKVAHAKKLMENYHLDPAKLSRATVVAQASAAIQSAAAAAGIQIGPVREGAGRSSADELASVEIEGTGPVPAVTGLLHNLESLGYPLVIDSVQLTSDPMRPGQLKLSLTVEVLDFDAWKPETTPHA
jgi:hypothetical protein